LVSLSSYTKNHLYPGEIYAFTAVPRDIFGNNIISTYGSNRTPYDKMLDVIKYWMQNLLGIYNADANVIEQLQQIKMDRKMTDELIGMLIRKAVLQNFGQKMNSPMNVTQVCRVIEGGSEILTKEQFDNFTAWDFCNTLTAVIKPKSSDLQAMLSTNYAVNHFVTDAFGIKYSGPTLNNN